MVVRCRGEHRRPWSGVSAARSGDTERAARYSGQRSAREWAPQSRRLRLRIAPDGPDSLLGLGWTPRHPGRANSSGRRFYGRFAPTTRYAGDCWPLLLESRGSKQKTSNATLLSASTALANDSTLRLRIFSTAATKSLAVAT